jgi:hypothetical protein
VRTGQRQLPLSIVPHNGNRNDEGKGNAQKTTTHDRGVNHQRHKHDLNEQIAFFDFNLGWKGQFKKIVPSDISKKDYVIKIESRVVESYL